MRKVNALWLVPVGGVALLMYVQRNRARFRCRNAAYFLNRTEGMSNAVAMTRAEEECGRPGPLKGPM